MKNNYINGMNEIKASESLKRKIISKAEESRANTNNFKEPWHPFTIKKSVALIAFVCTFAIVMTLSFPNIKNNSTKQATGSGVNKAVNNFTITAYAADGSTVNIKPNVEFSLGGYTPEMNSVPGFPLKIVCKDADTIKLTSTDGEFLLWPYPSREIQHKGKDFNIKSGDTLYWSPIINSNTAITNNCTISIKAYKDNKVIGTNSIKIQLDSNNFYVGKLIE